MQRGNRIIPWVALAALPGWATPAQNHLPLRFEVNRGQCDARAKFVSRGPGYSLLLTDSGSVLRLRKGARDAAVYTRIRGAAPGRLEGLDALGGSTNYLHGAQPERWLRDVPAYGRVRYASVYPGIDLVFHGSGQALEYDFVVAPGADPARIQLEITGADKLRITTGGDLVMDTPAGQVRWLKPRLYQQTRAVDGTFALRGNRIGFHVGRYNRTQPLVIDPTLSYSTYLGGSENDFAKGIALDSSGNVYVVGTTASMNLPFTAGSVQPAFAGGTMAFTSTGDAFVAKIQPGGTQVAYVTYLGGSLDDLGMAIAVDASGNAYVTGYTNSTDFPLQNALQKSYGGPPLPQGVSDINNFHTGGDAFVAKLNPTGNALVYSTYLGGSADDRGTAITLDSAGNAYVAGTTLSTNFPVSANAFQKTMKGGGGQPTVCDICNSIITTGDAFVAKIAPDGSQVLFATLLGGSLDDVPFGILLTAQGNVVLGGATLSSDFPTTSGAYQKSYHGANSNQVLEMLGDAFLAEFNSDGSQLLYSTYFGGSADDLISSMTTDVTGAIYVTGLTSSADFPTTEGPKFKGPSTAIGTRTFIAGDAFVAKFNLTATPALVFSTYLGGTDDDGGSGIALDPAGNIYITGFTNSTDFPLSSDAFQKTFGGTAGGPSPDTHVFFTKMDPAAANVLYSTLLGGSVKDIALGLTLDSAGNAYIAGVTSSPDFPTASPLQKTYGGGADSNGLVGDAFIAKFSGLFGAGPVVNSGGVVNPDGNAIAPGGIVSIYGMNLAPQIVTAGSIPLTTSLGNVSVTINGELAPLYFVSALQINVQAPWDLNTSQPASVVVTNNSVNSAPVSAVVQQSFPSVLQYLGHAIAFNNSDGDIAAPAGTIPGLTTHPAKHGDAIVIFATGLGAVDHSVATGGIPPSGVLVNTIAIPTVLVGGKSAQVLFHGLSPQFVGVNQVNILVPADAPTGNSVPLQIQIGNNTSPMTVTMAIE